jgi:hypothetical protein
VPFWRSRSAMSTLLWAWLKALSPCVRFCPTLTRAGLEDNPVQNPGTWALSSI